MPSPIPRQAAEPRFTLFASPDSLGLPLWQVFDRNVLCDPTLYRDRARAEASRAAFQDRATADAGAA